MPRSQTRSVRGQTIQKRPYLANLNLRAHLSKKGKGLFPVLPSLQEIAARTRNLPEVAKPNRFALTLAKSTMNLQSLKVQLLGAVKITRNPRDHPKIA